MDAPRVSGFRKPRALRSGMAEIVFLHGLESHTDPDGVPMGRKASWLRANYDTTTPALDTRRAVASAHATLGAGRLWVYPFDDYEAAFETPLARARAAIGPDTKLVIGSSFGGAVLLRLLHEAPRWRGAAIFLAGAGPKLTPHRALPPDQRCLLIHGASDDVVPPGDSLALAGTSPLAAHWPIEDDHRLGTILESGLLARAIDWALAGG